MDTQTIKKYESMAKLDLSDETRAWMIDTINMLEESFRKLEQIDTDGIQPLINVLNLNAPLREDEVKKIFTREQILSNAPQENNGYFEVPKILE